MIFHENRLLADDSHEISYLIFFRKLRKMSKNVSSAAVVIGVLRVNIGQKGYFQDVRPRRISIRKNDSTRPEVEN